MRTTKKTPERIVKDAIKQLAPHIGLYIWAILGGLGQAPGIADFLGIHRGRPVAIETKAGKNRLSQAQREFKKAWEAAGGIYIEARGPEDVCRGLGVKGVLFG